MVVIEQLYRMVTNSGLPESKPRYVHHGSMTLGKSCLHVMPSFGREMRTAATFQSGKEGGWFCREALSISLTKSKEQINKAGWGDVSVIKALALYM